MNKIIFNYIFFLIYKIGNERGFAKGGGNEMEDKK